ncbi:hypothetical protein Tco_0719503 [Tanacetum coccineum]
MEDRDMTMEEYLQYENEKALRNDKIYNWETGTYGKIRYVEDINDLRFFETKFLAIVDEVNWKIETSLSKSNDEKYTVIYDNDLFSYKIFPVNDSKLDMDNYDDKIDTKRSLGDISIEPLHNVISIKLEEYEHWSKRHGFGRGKQA